MILGQSFLKMATWTAAVSAVALTAAQSSAVTYMGETFDGAVEGATVVSVAAPGPGWTTVSVGTGNELITTAAAQSTIGGGSGLGLQMTDTDTTGTSPNLRFQFASPITLGVGATDPFVQFSFDFNMRNNLDFSNFVPFLQGTTAGAFSNLRGPGAYLDRNDDGDIYARSVTGGTGAQVYNDLASDVWYRMTIDVNTVAKTYTIKLYDASLALVTPSNLANTQNVAIDAGDANAIDNLSGMFLVDNNGGGAGGVIWFDNFVVTSVPEPASLALLGLGGLAMVRRRR